MTRTAVPALPTTTHPATDAISGTYTSTAAGAASGTAETFSLPPGSTSQVADADTDPTPAQADVPPQAVLINVEALLDPIAGELVLNTLSLARAFHTSGVAVLLLADQVEILRAALTAQLEGAVYDALYLRPVGDSGPTEQVYRDILDAHIVDRFEPVLAVEPDWSSDTVAMWRAAGVPVHTVHQAAYDDHAL